MKNYNKILEAVNRGIQLALDDFDDVEIQNVKPKSTTSFIKSNHSLVPP